jgi:hypothetical protein
MRRQASSAEAQAKARIVRQSLSEGRLSAKAHVKADFACQSPCKGRPRPPKLMQRQTSPVEAHAKADFVCRSSCKADFVCRSLSKRRQTSPAKAHAKADFACRSSCKGRLRLPKLMQGRLRLPKLKRRQTSPAKAHVKADFVCQSSCKGRLRLPKLKRRQMGEAGMHLFRRPGSFQALLRCLLECFKRSSCEKPLPPLTSGPVSLHL